MLDTWGPDLDEESVALLLVAPFSVVDVEVVIEAPLAIELLVLVELLLSAVCNKEPTVISLHHISIPNIIIREVLLDRI